MKKILPLVAVFGTSVLLVGCGNQMTTISSNNANFKENIETFKESLEDYSNLNDEHAIKTSLNKYTLSLSSPDVNQLNETLKNSVSPEVVAEDDKITDTTTPEETTDNNENNATETENEELIDSEENQIIENDDEVESFSTLYSLSSDIEDSCDEFCELKEEISNAILETQNLITKIQSKEIELDAQQRLFLSEQSAQLKNLGRQLSNVTTELSINLSDLNNLMLTGNGDVDNLSLKYLIVLDNLVNGNEMLQNGLNSLNLMNQMMNLRAGTLPPNNQGRILYGFRQNNEEPIIKDYYFNENGDLIENNETQDETNENSQDLQNNDGLNVNTENSEKKTNVDTFKNTNLVSNIDTYGNHYRNIDTFYNTALFDNEFMYGTGGYGYGGGFAPGYTNGYAMRGNYDEFNQYDNVNRNTMYGVNDNINTQNNQTQTIEKHEKKNEKRFKLSKNVDTYRDENTPTLKTRFANIKQGFSNFLGKFSKPDDRVKNPVYRFNEESNEGTES